MMKFKDWLLEAGSFSNSVAVFSLPIGMGRREWPNSKKRKKMMESYDLIQGLSPVHYRSVNDDEKEAYNAAYNEFLKYHGHDEGRAKYFSQMLEDALYRRDSGMLMIWYKTKKMA